MRYADAKFAEAEKALTPKPGSRLTPGPDAYKARGVLYLAPEARFSHLRDLPEGSNIGRALNQAMTDVEAANPELADALPKNYQEVPNETLVELIKLLDPVDLEGDAFGRVYELMMGEFAMQEMQKGGEFHTPAAIVRLIVEIIEPYHGRILDPACGSGGMFVHSANFVREHKHEPGRELSIFGIEKTRETLRLAKMNLAIHGLSGEIKEANSYYEDPFECVGRFDFVMANPPFNVDGIDKGGLAKDPRFPFGLPTPDNANYVWIELFYAALGPKGRAGFVMANSAADARGSELEIRKKLIESGAVDVMLSVGPNFFYTVTLPCTLWFFDKGKAKGTRGDDVLFIDARRIFRQIDRAHRDFTPSQIEFLANIVRIWRGTETFLDKSSSAEVKTNFPDGKYRDIQGLCKSASRKEIEGQGWSLNPGRYVGVAPGKLDENTYRYWTKRVVSRPGDLIIAREAPVGNVALITPGQTVCLGQRTVLIRPMTELVGAQYLTHFLLGDYVQNYFYSCSIGATVPHLNMKDIRSLPLPPLLSLSVQRRIAGTLSAYDDLIEVNARRISILEEMARRLFDERFVRFRFPGCDSEAS